MTMANRIICWKDAHEQSLGMSAIEDTSAVYSNELSRRSSLRFPLRPAVLTKEIDGLCLKLGLVAMRSYAAMRGWLHYGPPDYSKWTVTYIGEVLLVSLWLLANLASSCKSSEHGIATCTDNVVSLNAAACYAKVSELGMFDNGKLRPLKSIPLIAVTTAVSRPGEYYPIFIIHSFNQ